MNKRLLLISIIILSLALYLHVVPFHESIPLKKAFTDFPHNWKGWKSDAYYFDAAVLDKLRVNEYIMREYKRGDDRFTLYIGYYGTQKEGAQIHSPKHCLPGAGWFKLLERKSSMNIDELGKINFIEALYKKGNEREIFIYWYKMKNAYITNEYVLKLYMILNSLKYRRNDAAFIRFSAPVTTSEDVTIRMTENAMKDFLPLLKDFLPE
ncbi:MAG: EpsI family protein [Nitrospirae bacterium]|nr:EpsI family protein [Nitrospirota bacterium]